MNTNSNPVNNRIITYQKKLFNQLWYLSVLTFIIEHLNKTLELNVNIQGSLL